MTPLRSTLRSPFFKLAIRDMAGAGVGIGAWGLVTGVAMVKSGMSVPMALLMSLLVYAGSAQLAVIPLLAVGGPLWVVWLTAACVNLRFVIFSSLWRCYFQHLPRRQRIVLGYFSGDVIFVAFMKRYPQPVPEPSQMPYFWGAAAVNWLGWQLPSVAGILLANAIPLSWGLGFAGVLALLGVLLSLLVDRAAWMATGVAATAAVATYALPLKLNILVAIAAAVLAGLAVEGWQQRQRKRSQATATGQLLAETAAGGSPAPAAPGAPAGVQPAKRQP